MTCDRAALRLLRWVADSHGESILLWAFSILLSFRAQRGICLSFPSRECQPAARFGSHGERFPRRGHLNLDFNQSRDCLS